jgi:hypothetical protein
MLASYNFSSTLYEVLIVVMNSVPYNVLFVNADMIIYFIL